MNMKLKADLVLIIFDKLHFTKQPKCSQNYLIFPKTFAKWKKKFHLLFLNIFQIFFDTHYCFNHVKNPIKNPKRKAEKKTSYLLEFFAQQADPDFDVIM